MWRWHSCKKFIEGAGDEDHPYLAHTPTMRVPKPITGTDNVYNAMRTMLLHGRGMAIKMMFLAYKSIKYPPQEIN